MKVLLTGAAGQLGQALVAASPEGVQLIACTRAELDLADPAACRAAVASHRPDWLLNAGAYTAVDKAESEPELAQAVNAGAPAVFAEALAEAGAIRSIPPRSSTNLGGIFAFSLMGSGSPSTIIESIFLGASVEALELNTFSSRKGRRPSQTLKSICYCSKRLHSICFIVSDICSTVIHFKASAPCGTNVLRNALHTPKSISGALANYRAFLL